MIGKRKAPSKYENGMWSEIKQRYNATKRECRGVFKVLKKTRVWLYRIYFIFEIDVQVLVTQLNRSGTDFPGVLIIK
jgi:hypothetical protein